MAWDDGLTAEQQRAASHVGQHARLLAGPGTGKTLVLTRHIVYLVRQAGVAPDRILALTFTRAANAELKRRVQAELGDDAARVIMYTLHSYALRVVLKQAGGRLPQPIRIADDFEERWIIEEDLKRILGLNQVRNARELLQQLSADWEQLTADQPGYNERFPNPAFLGAWQEHRTIFGYVLRAELVYQLKHALEEGVNIGETPRHILVDEYQDLNACDLAVIQRLTALGAELFVAGDDDQSIYGFRYANPEGIRRFDREYTPSTSLGLEECRRCDSRVLDVALYIARQDARRIEKRLIAVAGAGTGEVRILNFSNQNDEAAGVARMCAWLINQRHVSPSEILILLRSDRNDRLFSEPIRRALQALGIPVATVAKPLAALDPPPGRALLSLLRLVVNRTDHLALRTLLRIQDNHVGDKGLSALYDLARARGLTFSAAVAAVVADSTILGKYGASVAKATTEIEAMVTEIAGRSRANLAEFIAGVSETYIADAELRAEFMAVFTRVLAVAPPDSLDDLLRTINVSLADRDQDVEQEIEAGAVNIMTMHQAKGLSADAVFVVAAEDEYIPGKAAGDAIGDERRLLYVSATRARHYLFFTHCRRRIGSQTHSGRTAGVQARNLTSFLSGGLVPSGVGAAYMSDIGA